VKPNPAEGAGARTHPLVDVGVEVVERDVGGGDEDVLNGGVEALQHGEVERPRALAVHREVRRHLRPPAAAVGHVPRRRG